jgi:AcrR family transcriptional regulator
MSPDAPDGRKARRERNRVAALDAAFELFAEGTALPTVDEVAARSGVSLRSMYRYFADAHEMHLLALARRTEVADPLYALDRIGEGSLQERIERVVDQRLRLYQELAPAIRLAFAIAPNLPGIQALIDARKKQLLAQLRDQFTTELGRCPAATGEGALLCVDVLCQFESLERLLVEAQLPEERVRDILCSGLHALLTRPEVAG